MTAKYFAILTNYGAAQLANAVALGTQMNISAMAVGDGGGMLPVPDPAQTKLVRETRRAAVNQVSIDEKNPNFIIAEQVIPENEGGWFIREIGLFDDNGGLIAVGNAPETYKPNLQEGSGRTQVIQMVLMVSSTQAITLKVDPSVVLATREYVTKSIDAAIQASEARAAKTYQPIGDYVLHPYLKLELLKKIDKADIAQQLGNDTSKVVSQNLLATELGKKASVADANSKLAKDQNGADIPDKPKFIENLGLGEWLKNQIEIPAGMFQTFPHRATQLPQKWYSTNGDRFSVTSPQGKVLKSFTAELKADWGITESGGMINVPNIKQPDGRTPFLRPVNGTTRQVGTIEQDMQRRITGAVHFRNRYNPGDSGSDEIFFDVNGALYGSKTTNKSGVVELSKNGELLPMHQLNIDSAKSVPTGSENTVLNAGVTLAIYLGV
ncbi:phage tail protein [Morganella morganii]|uniref:phage tail protein n=1 Tax=Morganella morganii TaxID=582 RepID=UPI00091F8689|nr:phage tail protein [Morganella morganii]SHM01761.1 Phage tail-collar fibre protein [Morganella morganii]